MSQFTTHGYGLVRNYIKGFKHIGFNDKATQIKRLDNPTVAVDGNTISYTVTLINADGSMTNKTVNKASLFESASSTNEIAYAEFTPFTFESIEDSLTITINIDIPSMA